MKWSEVKGREEKKEIDVMRERECKRERERERERRGNSWEKRSKTMLNYVIQHHILIFR